MESTRDKRQTDEIDELTTTENRTEVKSTAKETFDMFADDAPIEVNCGFLFLNEYPIIKFLSC
jgi:hypothetical protein